VRKITGYHDSQLVSLRSDASVLYFSVEQCTLHSLGINISGSAKQ